MVPLALSMAAMDPHPPPPAREGEGEGDLLLTRTVTFRAPPKMPSYSSGEGFITK